MDAGGAAGERHVEAIVHEHARRAAARQRDQLLHEVGKRGRLEIALADLQVVDARVDGMPRLLRAGSAAPRRGRREPPANRRRSVTSCRIRARPGSWRECRAVGASREDRRQLGDARQEVGEPKAGDAAAHERVGDERRQHRPALREVVALPESGPRQHHQQQADFEEVRDEEETPEQGHYPRARTFASRSIRAATSR